MQKPKDTPFELLALLLLTSPDGLTYQKLVLLPKFGERNHQLLAEPPRRYFAARNLFKQGFITFLVLIL